MFFKQEQTQWVATKPRRNLFIFLPTFISIFAASQTQLNFSGVQNVTTTETSVDIHVWEGEDGTISFPKDGHQPPTSVAAKNSQANNPDQRITDWYMKAFGYTDQPQQTALKLGFAPITGHTVKPQEPTPIITLCRTAEPNSRHVEKRRHSDSSLQCLRRPENSETVFRDESNEMDIDDRLTKTVVDRTNKKLSRREAFWTEFRRVADNPIGRVLLYRLLIEIRREYEAMGCEATGLKISGGRNQVELEVMRNNARSLVCIHGQNDLDWRYYSGSSDGNSSYITCYLEHSTEINYPVVTTRPSSNQLAVTMIQSNLTSNLFHELLHWYQSLVNIERFNAEYEKNAGSLVETDLLVDYGYPYQAFQASLWTDNHWPLDELRIICGSRPGGRNQFLEGDDLSENAFRCSKGLPLRFGLLSAGLEKADSVTSWAIRVAHSNACRCVRNITRKTVYYWSLRKGEALQ